MTQQQIYQAWKPSVLGHGVDIDRAYGNQCVDVVLSYAEALFPGAAWSKVVPPTPSAKNLGKTHNATYFDWIVNDHNDPEQLPQQGDIIVCDSTPQAGYSNTYNNPDGHTGVVDHCDSNGYTLLQQDGSNPNGAAFLSTVAWRYRPVLGWLRPRLNAVDRPVSTPDPTPAPAPSGQTLFLPSSVLKWRVYNVHGPYSVGHEVAFVWPSISPPGLSYKIEKQLAPGVYQITTEDFGTVAIWTGRPGVDTDAVIK